MYRFIPFFDVLTPCDLNVAHVYAQVCCLSRPPVPTSHVLKSLRVLMSHIPESPCSRVPAFPRPHVPKTRVPESHVPLLVTAQACYRQVNVSFAKKKIKQQEKRIFSSAFVLKCTLELAYFGILSKCLIDPLTLSRLQFMSITPSRYRGYSLCQSISLTFRGIK